MEDEAEIYDGIRAHFPITFGKQSKPQTSLEVIHSATRRTTTTTNLPENPKPSSSIANKPTTEIPSVSSSSRAWLTSLRNLKPTNPNPNSSANGGPETDEAKLIGPPRPPPSAQLRSDDEEEGIIGPPRPPVGQLGSEDEEEEMIGPPRPPPGPNVGESGSDDEDDDDEEEEDKNRYRIPHSNEIVLKGHTKVLLFTSQSLISCFDDSHLSKLQWVDYVEWKMKWRCLWSIMLWIGVENRDFKLHF
jgi:hypothetical protein